jgi:diacylglycerol kinase family enzyme
MSAAGNKSNKNCVICLLNPLSCDGRSAERCPEIATIFKSLDIPCEIVHVQGDLTTHVYEMLANINPANTTIAGIGGDGTHHALINGMMQYKQDNPGVVLPCYSIIPMGTGNNLAKSFGIKAAENLLSNDLRRALLATCFGARFDMDLGKSGSAYFVDAFTAGADAHILAGRDEDKKQLKRSRLLFRLLKGYPLYLINVFKSLRRFKPLKATITVDGNVWYEGELYNVIINNCRIYAGEFDLTDTAVANDGLLDMIIFKGRRDYIWRYMFSNRYLPRRFRSLASAKEAFVQKVKGSSFHIEFSEKVPIQVDGEVEEEVNCIDIETVPRCITLKLPVEPP